MEETFFGRIRGLTLADVLDRVLRLCVPRATAVVRGIDSARSSCDLRRILDFHNVTYEINGGNVCLDADSLNEAVAREVFTGFDELWIFREMKSDLNLVDVPPATSEVTDFSIKLPQEISDTFSRNDCLLVLGDGCGLNYFTSDSRIADVIVETDARGSVSEGS